MQTSGRILHRALKYNSLNYVACRRLATFSNHPAASSLPMSNTFSGNQKDISKIEFLQCFSVSSLQIRLKTYKDMRKNAKSRSPEYESGSDSDSDDDIPSEPQHGAKVAQIQTDSLRCDLVLKNGLGISRNKLDKFFYEGRIRINGEKMMKKSMNVDLRDEIDLIKNFDEENPNLIHVGRVEILKAKPSGDFILLTIRKFKNLLIENYEKDPWEEKSSEKEDDGDEENDKKEKN